MSPSGFCKCGSALCEYVCCKTLQDPKTCDGIWHGNERKQVSEID